MHLYRRLDADRYVRFDPARDAYCVVPADLVPPLVPVSRGGVARALSDGRGGRSTDPHKLVAYLMLLAQERAARRGNPAAAEPYLRHLADLAADPDRLDAAMGRELSWAPYEGPRGGRGWKDDATGRVRYGGDHAPGAKRERQKASAAKAREITTAVMNGEATADHLQELQDHLPALTVDQLRNARIRMGVGLGGRRRRAEMVSQLMAHVRGLVEEERAGGLRPVPRDEPAERLSKPVKGKHKPTPEDLDDAYHSQEAHDALERANRQADDGGYSDVEAEQQARLGDRATRAAAWQRDKPHSVAAAEAARAAKAKLARSTKKYDSLYHTVIGYGGVDPNSHDLKTFFKNTNEAMEYGVPLGIFKKGGGGLDAVAAEMAADGHISTADGRSASEVLLDGLAKKAYSQHADLTEQYAQAEDDYWRKLEEAHAAAGEPEVAAAVRGGEEAGRLEGETDPLGEGQGRTGGSGETGDGGGVGESGDGLSDAAEPDGGVDDSFDFGEAAASAEPTPEDIAGHKEAAQEEARQASVTRTKHVKQAERAKKQLDQLAGRADAAKAEVRRATEIGNESERQRWEQEHRTVTAEISRQTDKWIAAKDAAKAIPDNSSHHASELLARRLADAYPDHYEVGDKLAADGTRTFKTPVKKSPADSPSPGAALPLTPAGLADSQSQERASAMAGKLAAGAVKDAADPDVQAQHLAGYQKGVDRLSGLSPERKEQLKARLAASPPAGRAAVHAAAVREHERAKAGKPAVQVEPAAPATGHAAADALLAGYHAAPTPRAKDHIEAALYNIGVEDPARPPARVAADAQRVARRLASEWGALHDADGTPAELAPLERAMAAHGMTRAGAPGEAVRFDGERHDAPAGMFPGDAAEVARPGWEMDGRAVLNGAVRPAKVSPKAGDAAGDASPARPKQAHELTAAEWNKLAQRLEINWTGTGGDSPLGMGRSTSEKGFARINAARDDIKNQLYGDHPRGGWVRYPDDTGKPVISQTAPKQGDSDYDDAHQIQFGHRDVIKAALAAGKPVPPEVLKDYPDLAPKTPPAKPSLDAAIASYLGATHGPDVDPARLAAIAAKAGVTPAEARAAVAARAATGAAPAEPRGPTAALSDTDFAAKVQAAGDAVPHGFGDSKVFLGDVYDALKAADPALTRPEFDRRVLAAHQSGHLELSRADMHEVMHPDDLARSEVPHLNTAFHFLRAAPRDRIPAKTRDRGESVPTEPSGAIPVTRVPLAAHEARVRDWIKTWMKHPAEKAKVDAIRADIRAGKELAPAVFKDYGDGSVEMLDGSHRAAAALLEGQSHIPAHVVTAETEHLLPPEQVARWAGKLPSDSPRPSQQAELRATEPVGKPADGSTPAEKRKQAAAARRRQADAQSASRKKAADRKAGK